MEVNSTRMELNKQNAMIIEAFGRLIQSGDALVDAFGHSTKQEDYHVMQAALINFESALKMAHYASFFNGYDGGQQDVKDIEIVQKETAKTT